LAKQGASNVNFLHRNCYRKIYQTKIERFSNLLRLISENVTLFTTILTATPEMPEQAQ